MSLAACGGAPKPATPPPVTPAPAVTSGRFGGSALSTLAEETIAFADASLAGAAPPEMSFAGPANVVGVRSDHPVQPALPVTWHSADIGLVAVAPLAKGYAVFEFELFIGPRGTRILDASAQTGNVAPPQPPPAVPDAIAAEVSALLERGKRGTLSELRFEAADLAALDNPALTAAFVRKDPLPSAVTELAKQLTGPALAIGVRNLGVLGRDAQQTPWIATGYLEAAGGRHQWRCDTPDDCRVFNTDPFPYLPLAVWQGDLDKLCAAAAELVLNKMAVSRKRQLFFERVPKVTASPMVRFHFEASASGIPNFLAWKTDLAEVGGPAGWSCPAFVTLFGVALSPKANPR